MSERKFTFLLTYYSDVVAHDPYHGKEVKKLECIGHIHKHLGARLRKLKTTFKSVLSEGKPIGGKGCDWQKNEWLISSKITLVLLLDNQKEKLYMN